MLSYHATSCPRSFATTSSLQCAKEARKCYTHEMLLTVNNMATDQGKIDDIADMMHLEKYNSG